MEAEVGSGAEVGSHVKGEVGSNVEAKMGSGVESGVELG